jgi:hypothetical protein
MYNINSRESFSAAPAYQGTSLLQGSKEKLHLKTTEMFGVCSLRSSWFLLLVCF